MKKCSICGEYFEGKGNNAMPVNEYVCCDKCNQEIVLPRRVTDIMLKRKGGKVI